MTNSLARYNENGLFKVTHKETGAFVKVFTFEYERFVVAGFRSGGKRPVFLSSPVVRESVPDRIERFFREQTRRRQRREGGEK